MRTLLLASVLVASRSLHPTAAFLPASLYKKATRTNVGERQLLQETSDDNTGVEGNAVPVTPCTRICRYNSNIFDGQVCIGCFRETYEIGSWQSLSAMEKYYTLLDAVDRLASAAQSNSVDESDTGTSRSELLRQAEYWKGVASQEG